VLYCCCIAVEYLVETCPHFCAPGHVLTVARPILLLGELCTVWFTVLLAVSHCVTLSSPIHGPRVSSPGAVRSQIIVCATCAVIFTMPRTFDLAMKVTWHAGDGKAVTSALADHPFYRLAYVNVLTLCAQYVVPLVLLTCISIRLTLLLSRKHQPLLHVCDAGQGQQCAQVATLTRDQRQCCSAGRSPLTVISVCSRQIAVYKPVRALP
jgi:hypothetical protein